MKPELFVAFRLPPELAALDDGRYVLHLGQGNAPALDNEARSRVRAIVTNGIRGAEKALLDCFPNLELIASLGIGLDALDLPAARARHHGHQYSRSHCRRCGGPDDGAGP